MCIFLWLPSSSLSLSAQCPVGRVWRDAWSHVALEINAPVRSLSHTDPAGQVPVMVRWHWHIITNSATQSRKLVSTGNASAQGWKFAIYGVDFMGSWMAELFMLSFQQKKAYWKRIENIAQWTNSSALKTLFMVPLTALNLPECLCGLELLNCSLVKLVYLISLICWELLFSQAFYVRESF